MSGADLQELEEIRGLIARGLQIGVLTHAEIASATAELGLEDTDVEELHEIFERCEIELVEEIDPATAANVTIERAPERRTRRKAALNLEPEGTTDGLQLFLKGIGKVRLLTAQEEVELSKRIERGSFEAKQRMVESNLRLVVSIAKRYRNQGLPRPDPGGHHWSRPCDREVRLPQGFQVLHLRHVVDPAGDRSCAGGQGADNPDPGSHR
jgi:RNA polymerase primary sigma factor